MKKLILFILLATCLKVSAHFPVIVDSDKSKGLISNVTFAPLQVGVGFFDKWQLYDGDAHSFVSAGILGLMQTVPGKDNGARAFAFSWGRGNGTRSIWFFGERQRRWRLCF